MDKGQNYFRHASLKNGPIYRRNQYITENILKKRFTWHTSLFVTHGTVSYHHRVSFPKKNTRVIGALGEEIAARYLIRHGFEIVARNYRKSYGEVDIIAQSLVHDSVLNETLGTLHFVEVKSVSYETQSALDFAVSHETWRPEEQVHAFKVHQISKIVETWVSEQNYIGVWQIDVLAVRMVPRERYARVKFIENIILG